FMCFNGGECVHRGLCDCSRFNATGSRCQTVYNTGAERDNICRTWGQYHFETFDGLYYYFSGKSTYVLVRQNEIDEQSFSIQVNNDPECKSSPYSCERSISLFFSGDEEIKLSSEVTYKGLGIQLPRAIGNVHIQKLAEYILVRHQYAFTLAWDGTSAVYIKLTPDYLDKTRGLCGNNNAVLQDDLETSYGKLTEDIAEFVESWRENRPLGSPDWDNSLNYEPPCLTQSQDALQKAYALCNTLRWPPFEQCHDYVSPFPYMASCTNDLCMSAADNSTWCRALTEYARACAHAGKPLHMWRTHFQQCVITCEEHLIYNECIDCCPVSCQQKTQCIDSELPCVDGCYCPDGLIYENKLCVKPTECPCDYHGSFYKAGSVVYEECNNCTCIEGKWTCTNLTCPAECSVSGDINFMTFDGRKYTFQAPCQYILAKSHRSGKFTVSLQNAPCGQNQDGSCIQSVSLILNQDPKRQVTLTHSGDVLIYDQYKISLPYSDDYFEIRKLSSVFLQIKSRIGLQILYDRQGLRLYLQVDDRWKDDTVGLCGTFNENMQDDFLSPVGVPESTPQLFGNSWKTSSACASGYDHSPVDPCDIHLQAASYAAEACSIITKELFAACHTYLSPVSYFEQCRRDTCKCGQICLCSALANYAHQCRRHGVIIDFRSSIPDCALSCEDTKEYSTCISTCGQTCQTFSMPETCSSDCVEGCACPVGMYLNSKTERCVQRNECPCYFQGIEYPPGENIITSLGKCHCKNGMMSCKNNIVQGCPEGQIYVNCSNPRANMELSRERTCENQLLNLTFSAHLPCLSGCVCPQGLVKHGDTCFEPGECPCSWKGKEYFPGDKVISSCYTCICQHGSFQCTFHPCPSMCTVYGDRHYRTFDGLTFDFFGGCKVHLVKSTSVTSFSVITQNVNCFNTGIICRKYLSINVGKSFIIFDDDTGNPSPSSYIDKLQKIHLWKAGFFTLVHFPNEHITILWDQRTTIHIQTGPQWQGELTGLCGNFDLKTINEMRTPENFELTNPQEFGSSWSAVECVDSSDIRNPCSLNPLREPFAKKECGILLSEMFEACHPVVDVTWFYSNCLTDTCGCNQGGDCECFCTSVSVYAHQCCQHGVIVDWRSPRVCPYDCEYFNKVLGKGPYKLVSYLDGEVTMAAKLLGGYVFPARAEDLVPGVAVNFMLTSGWYKPKAHDPNLVSFETADRPNYFLHLASNGTLLLSKWEESEEFHNRSTFAIHKNTWLPGYSSFESFAKPGSFIHISASSITLLKYQHSEAFRQSALFKLVDAKFKFPAHSTCEWRYDACRSPCFKTCRDPLGQNCQDVPKVEGCVPMCPPHMVLDEVTQRCVYFEDCIEPAVDVQPSLSTMKTPTLSHCLGCSSFESTIAMSVSPKSNASLPSVLDVFPSTISATTEISAGIQAISSTTDTEKTTTYFTKSTVSPSLEFSTYAPTANQTRTSEETKLSTEQTFFTLANVTETSFLPPTTSETTKGTVVFTKERIKTTFFPPPTHPIPLLPVTLSITEIPTDISAASPALTASKSARAPPLPTKPTTSSQRTSTEYKSPLFLNTTTMSIASDTIRTTTSATKTSAFAKEIMDLVPTIPLATKKLESIQTTFITESPHTLLNETKTTRMIVPPDESQTETITSVHARKPTTFASSPVSMIASSSVRTSSEAAIITTSILYPKTTILKSTFPAEGKTPHLTTSTLSTIADQPSSLKALSPDELPAKVTLNITDATLSPYSEFSSRLITNTKTVSTILAPPKTSSTPTTMEEESLAGTLLTPVISTTSTSVGKSATEKTVVLSKHVPLSTTSYSSMFQVGTVLPATARSVRTTTVLAPSSVRKPTYFSVPSETDKAVASETAEPAGPELVTRPQTVHTSNTTVMPHKATKPLYESATEYSGGLTTAEAISGVTASVFMPSRETATLQTCVPTTESECIKHICLDGQLIQVNKSQNCPYNATQPSCGVLGLAVQINGDKCCPKWECACRCTFFSDLSFVTFDGNHLALFKEASYIVSQTQDETITIHILDCRNTNMDHLNLTSLCLAMLNLTYLSNQITVDRINRKITVNSRYAWPTVRKYGFKIEDTGFMYLIETPTNIRIQWFHSTGVLIIKSNTTSEPKALGLCGFCDGRSANDLMLPNRTILSKTDAPSNFIDTWQVPDTLKYVGEDRHQETNCSILDCSKCFSLVLNQTFSSCHPYVPPELFCDLWVRDVEYTQNPCVALASYVAMCNKFNICIEWRSSEYCAFPCSEGTTYQACIAACDVPSMCQNGEPSPLDLEPCSVLTEGCVCSEGTLLHRAHSALCITEEKCACTDSLGAPHAVGEIWKTSLSGCCMHKCVDNETIIPVEYNCSDIHDVDCQRFGEMALIVPDDQTCCPQKICICNQSFCDSFIPECKGLEKIVTYYREDSCCPNYTCECDPSKCEPVEQSQTCREDQTLIAARVESTCCISYICACGVCSDQIPKCQEGEVLTVDGNTTDRCCPAYQCVCETYRCHEFQCALGMSLVEVWSPEKCCPYRTCECSCDTITKPQCKLGEKLQIDEQFQNSKENVCGCTKYKCVRDKVCLNNERGVLHPGQTVVERTPDGICHTSYCTNMIDPATKYYRINISWINCVIKCEANQVYEPPKDLTTCCGHCKNVSCVHTFSNGTVSNFKPGTSWISNCVKYDCTTTAVGPVLITSSISCPPFNETECVKVGGYVVPFLDGCCKTCKEDGKFCKKVTVRMTIRKNDCRSNTPVNIVSCDGKCPSASIYNYNINTYARFCKCCRELGLQRRTVQLYCSGNSTWVNYSIQEPTDCSCQWS
uniref:Otogelin n=1 Tax=Pelodiscus sinensis TaxID=13735 RepID=K7FTZ5_PELSI